MLSQATSKDNQVIIVSEPSAEATRRVRTRRYTLACCRSSAAPNDTPGCADAQPISVHTDVLAGETVCGFGFEAFQVGEGSHR